VAAGAETGAAAEPPILGGGVINIPLLVLLLAAAPLLPSTELIGACEASLEEHPASQSEMNVAVATRRAVNFGLPALIYPPGLLSVIDYYDDRGSARPAGSK